MSKYSIAAIAIVGIIFAYILFGPSSSDSVESITYTAQRGDLRITVLEGGNIQAQESQEIRSEIKGRTGTKILSIVEEGYLVTQEDIDNGLILVELETSTLEDKKVNQEIATQTAGATFTERKAQYDIQLNLNKSMISAAELAVKFSRMDFEKFLGEKAVHKIIAQLDMEKYFSTDISASNLSVPNSNSSTSLIVKPVDTSQKPTTDNGNTERRRRNNARGNGNGSRPSGERIRGFDPARIKKMIEDNGGEVPGFIKERLESMGISVEDMMKRLNEAPKAPPEKVAVEAPQIVSTALDDEYRKARAAIDFSAFADEDTLEDGEAKQTLRKLDSDALLALQDAKLAKIRLEGQKRLAAKNFITKTDLDLEQVKSDKAEIRVETTRTERELYIKYSFPKLAEKFFSDYEEALMGLQRKNKEAESKMAQEYARRTSAERKYNLELKEFEDIKEQLEKCIIRALRPGLVVYGSSTNQSPWRRSSEEPIQEGTTLRERQRIITIPDMTHMGVKVDIKESSVQKVAIGQSVTIHIDAFPGRELQGKVVKVAVLADSANAFLNPDLKVYPTVIAIDGTHDWLRPNMSAEIEILIEELNDVVYIPIQAVTYQGDIQICYVKKGGKSEIREIILGSFTEVFIEIKEGLEPGEEVLMLLPISSERDTPSNIEEKQDDPASIPAT